MRSHAVGSTVRADIGGLCAQNDIVKALRPVPPIHINYTNHVHKIGAKSIQNEAKSGPGAVPETLPKKSSKKLPKVNQKAPKVDQKAPQNDPKNVFKLIKNGLGAFVSTSKKQ